MIWAYFIPWLWKVPKRGSILLYKAKIWEESPFLSNLKGIQRGLETACNKSLMKAQVVCPLPFEWPYSCLGMPYALWNTYARTPYENDESEEK